MDETTQPVQPPIEPKKGGSKKVLWIIVGIIILIAVGGMVSGGFQKKLGTPYFMPDGVDVDKNADGSTTYTNESATVTVNGGGMPANWPSDAPEAYDGATIIYSGENNPATGKAGSAVVYTTNASLSSVVEYYTARLRSEGWTIESNAVAAGMTVITAKKDTRLFVAYAGSSNGTTQVTSGVEFGE
jgi:hypothetical protein